MTQLKADVNGIVAAVNTDRRVTRTCVVISVVMLVVSRRIVNIMRPDVRRRAVINVIGDHGGHVVNSGIVMMVHMLATEVICHCGRSCST